jgi:Tol biopolymer transport system component
MITDVDGKHAKLVLSGEARSIRVAPDGKFAVAASRRIGTDAIWMIPLDGREPVRVADVAGVGSIDISPNGRTLLIETVNSRPGSSFIVCDMPDCGQPRPVSLPPRVAHAHWTPKGTSIAFTSAGSPDVWVLSEDGAKPNQLTHFTDSYDLVEFAWSYDGKQLAIARGTIATDVVLFKGLKD